LLEQENPSARYLTLRYLLDSGEKDSLVAEARAAIAGWPPVREILAAMDAVNFWGQADRPFYGGAVGTHATLHLLAELGLPRSPQIEAACENLFECGQHASSGFTCDGTPGQIMLCYTGNATRTLVHFGYLGDPRLERTFDYLVARSASPGGLACPCADGEECRWGIAKVLAAFAALPTAKRTPERLRAARVFSDAVLDHEFDLKGRDKRWRDFGFPLDYQSDLVELCDALARLDYGTDPRFQRLLKVVLKARTRDGRWIKRYGTRALQVEEHGQPSKWITIRALRAIKHAHQAVLQAERARLRESEAG
jgi:hypothetical protein